MALNVAGNQIASTQAANPIIANTSRQTVLATLRAAIMGTEFLFLLLLAHSVPS